MEAFEHVSMQIVANVKEILSWNTRMKKLHVVGNKNKYHITSGQLRHNLVWRHDFSQYILLEK